MSFTPIKDRIEYGGCLIGIAEVEAIMKTIFNQGGKRWTVGPESVAFEQELAKVAQVKHAVVVNSGSSALLAATTALHLPKGSKVIIPALNFPTAYSSLLQCGLIPLVIDCDLKTLNLSLDEVEKAIAEHPDVKAVVAVHVAGNCVDLVRLREIVGDRIIISDNCDGFGGMLNGQMIDSLADVSCVSFHAAHIISTGEGGAVLTNNEEIATRARKIREWGRASGTDNLTLHEGFPPDYRERYVFEEIGYNMKPLELQCAMGRVQLQKLQDFKDKRSSNHTRLQKIFDRSGKVQLIEEVKGADNCWFSFAFLTPDRPRVGKLFEDNNIEIRTIFSGNILKHPAYKNEPHIKFGELANSEDVMRSGMFITCHPQTTNEMLNFIEEVAEKI